MEGVPSWAGTAPQWAMFVTLVIAVLKMWPTYRKADHDDRRLSMDEAAALRREAAKLREEVRNLGDSLNDCEEECRKEIKGLHEEMWGLRKQHIAEQISLINVILKSVDAPELHSLLEVLESLKMRLATAAIAKEQGDRDNAERS